MVATPRKLLASGHDASAQILQGNARGTTFHSTLELVPWSASIVMSTNPFLAQAAQANRTEKSVQNEGHASVLDDLVGLDLSSPTFSTASQAHVPHALASPDSGAPAGIHAPVQESGFGESASLFAGGTYRSPVSKQAPLPEQSPQETQYETGGSSAYASKEPAANTGTPYATGTQYTTTAAPKNPFLASASYQEPSAPVSSYESSAPAAYESSAPATSYMAPASSAYTTSAPTSYTTPAPTSYATTSVPTSSNAPASGLGLYSAQDAPSYAARDVPAAPQGTSSYATQDAPALSYLAPAAGVTTGAATATAATAATESTPSAPAQNQDQIDADAEIARALAQEGSADEVQWSLKDLSWNGRNTKIIMQNENGPCSLIALCNVLLLEGRLEITPADRPAVSYSYLSSKLTELLLAQNVGNNASQLGAALRVLPSLQRGLDVDIGFDAPTHFVSDSSGADALALFRLAGVSLVHGWLPDPSEQPMYSAVQQAGSYNGATLAVANGDAQTNGHVISSSSNPFGTASASSGAEQAALVQEFLEEHKTQLTPYGIAQLRQTLPAGTLSVLFRNSHLSVIYRRRSNEGEGGSPELFTLVTDAGFLMEDRIVWESLQDPRGEYNNYFDSHFVYAPYTGSARRRGQDAGADSDYQLALELQKQERSRALAARRAYRERTSQRPQDDYSGSTNDNAPPYPGSSNPLKKMFSKLKRNK